LPRSDDNLVAIESGPFPESLRSLRLFLTVLTAL
jgi:hypothetical protein